MALSRRTGWRGAAELSQLPKPNTPTRFQEGACLQLEITTGAMKLYKQIWGRGRGGGNLFARVTIVNGANVGQNEIVLGRDYHHKESLICSRSRPQVAVNCFQLLFLPPLLKGSFIIYFIWKVCSGSLSIFFLPLFNQ